MRRTLRTSRLIALASLVALIAIPGARTGRPASATPPGVNGRIVFSSSGLIYTVNPDGSALRLVADEGFNFGADWSPDARQIAYASDRSGSLRIWISDADGTHPRQLTPEDPDTADLLPHFTPDGRTILFQNCLGADCDGGIFSVRTDGTDPRVIAPNSGDSFNWPVPSPDGARIAFNQWHVAGIKMGIHVMRADGTRNRLLSPRQLEGFGPDWAPDGRRILFSSNVDRPNSAIYSMTADGSHVRRLTHPKFPFDDFAASYSPDGKRIVFASDRLHDDRCCSDIFTMRADGKKITRVPLSVPANFPRWGTAPLLSGESQNAPASTRAAAPAAPSDLRWCAILPPLVGDSLCEGRARSGQLDRLLRGMTWLELPNSSISRDGSRTSVEAFGTSVGRTRGES